MGNTIQVLKPKFAVDDCLAEIKDCLEKGWTGIGDKTDIFETKWKEYSGFRNAHFLNSATAGLHLAVRVFKDAYRWKKDIEIISTPMSFVSTNHAILYEGFKPVFADIDESLCLNPASILSRITSKTKAVMFVGIGGNVGRYREVVELCKDRDLKLILDASHMSGTLWKDGENQVGTEADVTIFSYQAVKPLPTGDSGMVCFKEDEHDALARQLSWLGIDKNTFNRSGDGEYKWEYSVEHLGYKYNGNSIMAAIALVQLKYLLRDNNYRRFLSAQYDKLLEGRVEIIRHSSDILSSRHLYQIVVPNRIKTIQILHDNHINPGVHYIDNTKYKMYKYAQGTCPQSMYYSDRLLSLPLHLELYSLDIEGICETLLEAL